GDGAPARSRRRDRRFLAHPPSRGPGGRLPRGRSAARDGARASRPSGPDSGRRRARRDLREGALHVNGAARAVARTPQTALRVEVVSGLGAIEAEWSALCDEARAGNVFLSPEWIVPWWKQFGEGREICSIA